MTLDRATPVRIALVCAGDAPLAGWAARLVERIKDDPAFDLVGRFTGTPLPAADTRSAMLAIERVLTRWFVAAPLPTGAKDILASLPVLDNARDAHVADIALVLGANILPASDLHRLATAEWSLHFADEPAHQSEQAIMIVLSRGAPVIPVTLIARSTTAPDGEPLLTAQYNIKPSATMTWEFLHDKAVTFLQRALACHGSDRPIDTGVANDQPPPAAPVPAPMSYPSLVLNATARKLAGRVRDRIARPADHWELHVANGKATGLDLSGLSPLPRLQWLMADPFLLEHEGDVYVFYEAMDKRGGAAWIEVARLEGTDLQPLGVALRTDYHLSFPQVFVHQGEVFMMPETQQNDRLEIWRATRFPLEWELHATALEGQLPADSILFQHSDGWWLFSNLSDHRTFQEHSSALYLFRVDGPGLNRITPHRLNPVVIGSDVARNAGCILSEDGQLYRPSQINIGGVYGYGLNMMRIDRLDDLDYRETLVRYVTPQGLKGVSGIHHITATNGKFVIDLHIDRSVSKSRQRIRNRLLVGAGV